MKYKTITRGQLFMYIALSIIIAIIGITMILKPGLIYDITESWKTYTDSEPSELYLFNTRLGGVVFLLIGIAGIIILLVCR
jgi:hypothetical protein